jgi:hypothetical protein
MMCLAKFMRSVKPSDTESFVGAVTNARMNSENRRPFSVTVISRFCHTSSHIFSLSRCKHDRGKMPRQNISIPPSFFSITAPQSFDRTLAPHPSSAKPSAAHLHPDRIPTSGSPCPPQPQPQSPLSLPTYPANPNPIPLAKRNLSPSRRNELYIPATGASGTVSRSAKKAYNGN